MRKIGEKIVGIILIMLVTLSITTNTSYAITQAEADSLSLGELTKRMHQIDNNLQKQTNPTKRQQLEAERKVYENAYNKKAIDGTAADALGVDPADNPGFYDPTSTGFGSYDKFIGKANSVLTVIRVVGTIASVLSLALIGVRYMVGSIEEKAEYKETMIPYIVGAIMLFAIPNLLGVIAKLVNSMRF